MLVGAPGASLECCVAGQGQKGAIHQRSCCLCTSCLCNLSQLLVSDAPPTACLMQCCLNPKQISSARVNRATCCLSEHTRRVQDKVGCSHQPLSSYNPSRTHPPQQQQRRHPRRDAAPVNCCSQQTSWCYEQQPTAAMKGAFSIKSKKTPYQVRLCGTARPQHAVKPLPSVQLCYSCHACRGTRS
jgi:hypothetical protein